MTSGSNFLRPIMPVTAAIIVGIGLGAFWPGHLRMAALLTVIFALACTWFALRQGPALSIPILFCVGVGYLSIQPWLSGELPDNHVGRFVNQGKWQIQGLVVDQPRLRQGRLQFVLKAVQLVKGDRIRAVCGKIKVTARGAAPALQRGDLITLRGHLRAIRNFANPGGFDYERHMALRGIRVRVYAQGGSLKLAAFSARPSWRTRIDRWRDDLGKQMDGTLSAYAPDTRSVLKALTLGERSGLAPKLREAFNRAGVGHVLAISGLHVGMVAYACFAVAAWLLAWIPWILTRGWTRKGAALLSLIPVLIYGLLAGLSPSTQRAMLTVSVGLLSFWVGRRHDWLNALSLAALIILAYHPPTLLSISFQLSFTAVLAIIMGLKVWSPQGQGLQKALGRRHLNRLKTFVWVSALAILGTLPLVMTYFNQVSLIGLITNLAVVPLVGLLVVPAGLLGIFCLPISSALAGLCWQAAALGLGVVVCIVQWAAHWSLAAVKTVTPSLMEIVLYYLLMAVLLLWHMRRLRMVGLVLVLVAGGLDGAYWTYQRFGRSGMTVTAIDVGQGSANLLQLAGGYTVLVDGGGFSDNSLFDVGAYILAPLLWRQKVRTIDLVVLTHPNSDHLNGLLYILRHFNVQEVWSNHESARTIGYGQWQKIILERNILHAPFDQLPDKVIRHGVQFEILAPSRDFLQRRRKESWRDANNNSLVLRARLGRISFLFTGDIAGPAETEILSRLGDDRLSSTVLFVPHHGSRSSSTASLLAAVRPAEALIAAGWHNRFGFPHAEVLKRLKAVGSRIWRTDLCGAIQITTDGKTYQVRPIRPGCP